MRNTSKTSIIVTIILVGMLGCMRSTFAETQKVKPDKLIFVYTRPKDHSVTQWLIAIYTEALKRMDIGFALEDVPPKRASLYSDAGDVDAELGRIYAYNETHPNMIRVEEHHALITFAAFVADPDLKLEGWGSLKDKDYRVEYRRGIKKCEAQLPRVVPSERLSEISTVHQGIQKMLDDRTDVYVDVEDFVLKYLDSDEFKGVSGGKAVYNAGLMESTTGHAFLHKKNATLVPQLAEKLKEMKAEGLFEKFRDQAGLSQFDMKW